VRIRTDKGLEDLDTVSRIDELAARIKDKMDNLREKLENVKMLALDFDGVFTDKPCFLLRERGRISDMQQGGQPRNTHAERKTKGHSHNCNIQGKE